MKRMTKQVKENAYELFEKGEKKTKTLRIWKNFKCRSGGEKGH